MHQHGIKRSKEVRLNHLTETYTKEEINKVLHPERERYDFRAEIDLGMEHM